MTHPFRGTAALARAFAAALAYRGLQLLPCVPAGGGLATTGFAKHGGALDWSWPIWSEWLSLDPVRSLLSLAELQQDRPARDRLYARGVVEIYRSSRIQVGNPPLHKLNFTPAESV
jgi:hypothetical protein